MSELAITYSPRLRRTTNFRIADHPEVNDEMATSLIIQCHFHVLGSVNSLTRSQVQGICWLRSAMETFTIGELAKECQINLETLRYYERLGLMPEPPRSSSGHRIYPTSALSRVHFIRRAQALGFSLAEIAELLALRRNQEDVCNDVIRQIEAKRREVDRKIADLESIRRALSRMKRLCNGDCLVGDCPILESLDTAKPSVRSRKRNPRRT